MPRIIRHIPREGYITLPTFITVALPAFLIFLCARNLQLITTSAFRAHSIIFNQLT